jgi:hypothetical protein
LLMVGSAASLVTAIIVHVADCFAAPEELSEEDQQLKSELDMLVERLTVEFPFDHNLL